MNRIHLRRTAMALFATGIISIWATPTLRAEDMDGPGHEHHMGDQDGHKDWKEKLGLTDDQSKKIETIHTAQKAEMEPLHQKMRVLKEKLRWQVDAKATDKELKATLDELQASFTSLQSAEQKYRKQSEAVLTPGQQAKSFLFMSEHFDRWEHRGHGREEGMRREHEEQQDQDE